MIRRRELMMLLGGAAAWPLAAPAQQGERMRRVGVLMAGANDAEGQARNTAFRNGLQALGWTDGGNVRFEERWSATDTDRARAQAAELVQLKPDVIMVNGIRALPALQQETRTIPIVFVGITDPVGQGFVASLARRGGNITGFSIFEVSIIGKMLETLKQIAPSVPRAAMLVNATHPSYSLYLRTFETIAPSLAIRTVPGPVRDADDIERFIEAFASEPAGGMLFPPDLLTSAHRELIAALASRFRVPAIYPYRAYVISGGLMSYGVEQIDLFRQAATYVDHILRGAKPSELPVQTPTKFELTINLKAARTLGLEVPATLLARADEVIE